MSNEIIINVTKQETRVALVQDGQLTELHIERAREKSIAGNIYKGKVVRVLPGMQAAFVNIGLERAAFLYVKDVYDDFDELKFDEENGNPPNGDNAPIQDLLQEGQEVMVQVSREPMGQKGAQITSRISLPGRYLVFLPTFNKIGVSRRIESEAKRLKLKKIVEKIKKTPGGLIVRTAAEDKKEDDLKLDMDYLHRLWEEIQNKKRTMGVPSLIHAELALTGRAMRDLFSLDVDRVTVDSKECYEEVLAFIDKYIPALKPVVFLYEDDEAIFDRYGIELEINRALDRKVWLKSGGSIAIDQTEALTAIDVNTGRYVGKRNFDDTILKTNLEAIREIVYQLRLRNMGGLIIIDFIDMERRGDQEKVMALLSQELRKDKTKTTILRISELGLVEMTRKRVRDNMMQIMCEPCAYCDGRGYLKSKSSICYEIFRELKKEAIATRNSSITLHVHPDIGNILCDTERGGIEDIEKDFGIKINIKANSNFHQEQYEIAARH